MRVCPYILTIELNIEALAAQPNYLAWIFYPRYPFLNGLLARALYSCDSFFFFYFLATTAAVKNNKMKTFVWKHKKRHNVKGEKLSFCDLEKVKYTGASPAGGIGGIARPIFIFAPPIYFLLSHYIFLKSEHRPYS